METLGSYRNVSFLEAVLGARTRFLWFRSRKVGTSSTYTLNPKP